MKIERWLDSFASARVLVVGDMVLDEYLIGRAGRISREAPIPVLEFEARQLIPGGAANPAANIAALGGHVSVLGVVGADAEGEALRSALTAMRIDAGALASDAARPTTVKTRVMAQMGLRFPQQVARLDRLSREPLSQAVEAMLISRLRAAIPQVDAVLFSDYRGGAVTPALVAAARTHARDLLLTADAQGRLDLYAGFGVVKCNADDAREVLHRPLQSDDDFAAAAQELFARLGLTLAMAITRGGDGMTLATSEAVLHARAPRTTEVYDTVGAGDTAIAALTLALLAGAPLAEAAALANTASGLVVQHVGNYAPTCDELRRALL